MNQRDTDRVDPITLAVVQGALSATQRAMTKTMEMTGRSSVYAIARDYSNCLFDWQPRMILQGEDLPTHLGSLIMATKTVAGYFGNDVHPGDVMFHNDPAYDGSHIVDMCMYKPIFAGDELMFWAVSKGHVIDAGGPVPGSYNRDAKEIYAEGLRIPPIKIVDRGERREDVVNLILTNVRSRRDQAGDMNAQLGAVTVAERRLTTLIEKYGIAMIRACVEQLLDQAETAMRSIIRERLPDGTYRASVVAEDTGHGRGDQTLGAHIDVTGDEMAIRLEAPPQLDYYTNSYRSNTLSGINAGLMMFAQVQPPYNEGLYRPISVDFGPPGTMLNASEPAPHVNCTGGPQETIADLIRETLSQADESSASAGWNHTWCVNLAGVHPDSGEPWVEILIGSIVGGGGAVMNLCDGWHTAGAQASMGGLKTGDSEFVELLAPIILHRVEIAEDSAGPGKWRGGCGLTIEVEPRGEEMTVIAWGEGSKYPVLGVAGAGATIVEPKLARGWHRRGSELLREVTQNGSFVVSRGERYTTRSQGGGGAGNPFERAPAAVLDDIVHEKVSVEAARIEYGVVVDPELLEIDAAATDAARREHAS